MSPQSIPYVVTQAFLFGVTMLFSRFGLRQFHPLTFVSLRLVLAGLVSGLVYLPWVRWKRSWPRDRRLWFHAATFGVLGTAIPMTAIVWSLQFQSSGVTSALITMGPALTVLLAHIFLPEENLNRRKSAGIVLAFLGALVLTLRGETGLADVANANPIGYMLVVIAVIFASSMTIYARRFMQGMNIYDVASIQIISSAVVVLPLTLATVDLDFTAVDAGGVISLGFSTLGGTFAAMILGFYIIERFNATSAAMTAYLIPIIAAFGGVLFLDERLTSGILAGLVLILVGVFLLNELNPHRDRERNA